MTHFYFEISINEEINDSRNILDNNDFPINYFASNKYFKIGIGDFIEGSFNIIENDLNVIFQFNMHKYPGTDSDFNLDYCPTIIYNKMNSDIEINTDIFGLDYIYIAVSKNGHICLSSHMKYLLANNSEFLNELDYDAILEYLFSHCVLQYKTIFTKIKLLPYNRIIKLKNWYDDPETILNINLENKIFRKIFPSDYNYEIDISAISKEIANDLTKIIKQFYKIDESEIVGFYLSGGLDSRTLIATVNDEMKHRTRAITFDCKKNGVESSKADKIAKLLQLKHNIKIIDQDDIISNSYTYLWKNEGKSNHNVSVILELLKQNSDLKLFIDGYVGDGQFGGEFLGGLLKYNKKKSTKQNLKLIDIMQTYEYAFPMKIFLKLLNKKKSDILKIIHNGFDEHCKLMWKTDNEILSMENLLAQTRGRCLTIGGGIRTTETYGLVLTPFYHPDIFYKYIQIPPKYRIKRNIQKQVLSNLNINIMKHSSTATKWYRGLKLSPIFKFALKTVVLFERLLNKKLLPNYSAIPFYDWLREKKTYYNFILEIFQNKNSLIWNLLDKENTIEFFEDFIKRKNSYHKFLLNIIDLELSLRIFMSINEEKNKIFLKSNVLDEKIPFINKLDLTDIRNQLKY